MLLFLCLLIFNRGLRVLKNSMLKSFSVVNHDFGRGLKPGLAGILWENLNPVSYFGDTSWENCHTSQKVSISLGLRWKDCNHSTQTLLCFSNTIAAVTVLVFPPWSDNKKCKSTYVYHLNNKSKYYCSQILASFSWICLFPFLPWDARQWKLGFGFVLF